MKPLRFSLPERLNGLIMSLMAWTGWRLLANRKEWFDDRFDYDGPSCYELGTGGPSGGDIQPHYVGETKNERKRMGQYACHGSHLSETIDRHLEEGWCLYYRGTALQTKAAAVEMQNRMLGYFKYDWNQLLNLDDKD
jgi:hypothetical protein